MVRKLRINEADGNLKQQIELWLQTLLEENFEEGLAQNLQGKLNGYDAEWCADSYDNNYEKAKQAYIQQVINTLFANFNQ